MKLINLLLQQKKSTNIENYNRRGKENLIYSISEQCKDLPYLVNFS